VLEQILRLGRRGRSYRPFCEARGVCPRGYSGPLQRAVTDFGADASFGAAAAKMREHYRIDVPVGAVRRHTLRHGKAIASLSDEAVNRPAKQLLTQMDGSMIPVMEPGRGADRRKAKQLYWREVRLCLARAADREQACYGATLGSSEVAGWLWQQVAQMAGLTEQSKVHGVGDGAPWIVEKFTDYFGDQGTYLIDFWHVSEYLGAAAEKIARPGKAVAWRHRQQGRLLENKVPQVLRSLREHCEPEESDEAPVRAAWAYITERAKHLDYAGSRKQRLPIGSGEVEGADRHVIQERLKLSGCWWKETNASCMLNLRTARANDLWAKYWLKN